MEQINSLTSKPTTKVLIVGGGFGGVSTALNLAKANDSNLHINLVSDRSHFEYHAALYRLVAGSSPLEVCIPLREIFKNTSVEINIEKITHIDLEKSIALGDAGSRYPFDYLVLAVGSDTVYFNIPGLKENSFGFKSIAEALALNKHLNSVFSQCPAQDPLTKECLAHIVVVGGGASGVELAGELAQFTKKLSTQYTVDPKFVKIDLVERADRVLPTLPQEISQQVHDRLKSLGVNVLLNKEVVKEDLESLFLKDMEMKTKTVIWTAGVRANPLYESIKQFELGKGLKVVVDEYLLAKGSSNIFVIGDGADTKYSGMAQTAILHGEIAAKNILNPCSVKVSETPPQYCVPVGRGWSVFYKEGSTPKYGYIGWIHRRLLDFKVFRFLLPFNKALDAFKSGRSVCDSCDVCIS